MKENRKNKKKKMGKRVLALALAVVMITGLTLPVVALAKEPNTPKQEVVYVNLNADGSVSQIYVVNIFELDEDGQIIDYGDYTALRNMTSEDEIAFENETVRIDTKAGKLYYEGILSEQSIPWDFSVKYYLDQKEYPAKEMAGKSGALELKIGIHQNPDCDSSFFDNYGLQASVTLDTEKCKNIVAEGATGANVGGDRQLTYMILPGTETDISITADVTDFEMSGIAINGLPLSMDVDVDLEENTEFDEQMDDLTDGVSDLDDGAHELKDGASDLKKGASDLKGGASDLKKGTSDLTDGSADLKDGAAALADGAEELNSGVSGLKDGSQKLVQGASDVKSGASDLNTAIKDAAAGASQLVEGTEGLKTGAETLNSGLNDLYSGLSALAGNSETLRTSAYQVFQQLCTQAQTQLNAQLTANGMQEITLTPENYAQVLDGLQSQLTEETVRQQIMVLKQQLGSYQTFYEGLKQYTAGVDQATVGAGELYNGSGSLVSGINELETGAKALDAGLKQIESGSGELLSGTITLYNGTTELSNGVVTLSDGSTSLLNGAVELENGTVELYDGAVKLENGTVDLLDGTIELYDGTVKLYDGTVELTDGTFEFKDKTSDMKTRLSDKIMDAVDDMLGGDFEVKSFVSQDNTEVESVQFVIKTPAIELEETEQEAEAEEEEPGFWERLMNLFHK